MDAAHWRRRWETLSRLVDRRFSDVPTSETKKAPRRRLQTRRGIMERTENGKRPAFSASAKRIMQELAELAREPSSLFRVRALEDDLFEVHFTIRGPTDSAFEEGLYHGRILLPPEYPYKPPEIMLLTPNGRFETGKRICLSVTQHHTETWQPSWGIRTILIALIGFMPSRGDGAVGALDFSDEERRLLARASQGWSCARCGMNHAAWTIEDTTGHENDIEPRTAVSERDAPPSSGRETPARVETVAQEMPSASGSADHPENAVSTSSRHLEDTETSAKDRATGQSIRACP
ncbi:Ubiquitin-conjugating enzyme E2 J1 [Cyanidiococcus yangmingshanensis]|uniref:Ubiquitin-conjugating enzyme E2 J1 n=1 Tax=Cyanidiococcus yangmingshanensis TaxID=2690220 RepID=A0A7J7IJK5_9RHOD|nr:Ubiquitin-conjugating enzyme E2 J1 [Cyanidiococcus yangmingshanensis]